MKTALPALAVTTALVLIFGPQTRAENIIQNYSFEDSNIVLQNGNNLGVTVPNWTVTDDSQSSATPTNLVKAFAGYTDGPDLAQDGQVYFDGDGTNVKLFQDFNIASGQTVSYSAYFSRRDQVAANGAVVRIFDSTGTTELSSSSVVDIPATTSQEQWFQSTGETYLAAGNYRMRIDLPNAANVDLVVLNAIPEPSTVAILTLGAVALGGAALRRRRV